MSVVELRDKELARQFLAQGLWLQRLAAPTAEGIGQTLGWALELLSSDDWLPPLGFVADLGRLLLDASAPASKITAPGVDHGLVRAYDDHVLARMAADPSLQRAADVLRRGRGRDQARGLAFVARQMRERHEFDVISVGTALLKDLLREAPARLLQEGWDGLAHDGLLPELRQTWESLIRAGRAAADWIGAEDVFELEHGTALSDFGQRLALRQALRAAAALAALVPAQRPRPGTERRQVATHMLDEDAYPVGGFSSLSTRGTIESLLQSQLALMEKVERPDLFDVKFVRDELLYYSRDENQFFRRRRTFAFVLAPDLVHARFKDPELPWQRVILLLGLLVAAVRMLTDWLGEDALSFEFLFLGPRDGLPLADELDLLRSLLPGQIANGAVTVDVIASAEAAARRYAHHARRSLCHGLIIGCDPKSLSLADATLDRLGVGGPVPALLLAEGGSVLAPTDGGDPLQPWAEALTRLLTAWL